MNKTMKMLPKNERPYEKCRSNGPESLSDKELLTVLIRSGTKEERADEVALNVISSLKDESLSNLSSLSFEDLIKIKGIGQVKALQILCLSELASRISCGKSLLGTCLNSPDAIAKYYMGLLRNRTKESLYLMVLDVKNRIIKEEEISRGTISSSICDPREIMRTALLHNGVSIVLIHNHPSGDPTPSRGDIKATENVLMAANTVGISLLDHIIVGNNDYVSLRARNVLKNW